MPLTITLTCQQKMMAGPKIQVTFMAIAEPGAAQPNQTNLSMQLDKATAAQFEIGETCMLTLTVDK